MSYLVQPQLINDPFGDAGLCLDFRFTKRALLFDIGDLGSLSPRKLLRISHVFVSHAHMDHFCGFDRLLGVCLGRPQRLAFYGPPGFIDRIEHKLSAYTWNLIANNEIDFVIGVMELHGGMLAKAAEFHTKDSFRRKDIPLPTASSGILLDEEDFRVRAVTLDHGIPCLAFAFEEKLRINIWRDRLEGLGLPVGPWLNKLKQAVRRGEPDEMLFTVPSAEDNNQREIRISLGRLKTEVLRVASGEKLAYVVDAAYHQDNVERIVALARGADLLFIEAVFLEEDAAIAARRLHLTAAQAGSLACRAGVKRFIPFHFSSRYIDREEQLRAEAWTAFTGLHPDGKENKTLAGDAL